MKIHLSTHVRHYTNGAATVDARGTNLEEMFQDLDRQFPGIRFRVIDEQGAIRQHMNIFIGGERAHHLKQPTPENTEVHIIGALSGG